MEDPLEIVLDYHEATKHHFQRYARGPGYLDWATQPDPFRRFEGAPLIPLEQVPLAPGILYDAVMEGELPDAEPLDRGTISALFFHSLALSAWKRAGSEKWALRVNPSSGNLHPTEGYLICPPVQGMHERHALHHYAPREHGLELRANLAPETWEICTLGLPPETLLVGLASIHWREAWKYGERAYRYCQLDVGHALGAIGLAAAGLGWQARLLDHWSTEEIASLCALDPSGGIEGEHADALLALFPAGTVPLEHPPEAEAERPLTIPRSHWIGTPNRLSSSHVHWNLIDDVAWACHKPRTAWRVKPAGTAGGVRRERTLRRHGLGTIIRQRRSAVSMDGVRALERAPFYRMLDRLMPDAVRPPVCLLPWIPRVHLIFFVHRVTGLRPGLYCLCRAPEETETLRAAMHGHFSWKRPDGCPEDLPFWLLQEGDFRGVAAQVSCFQDIASEGCFSLGMIARFENDLRHEGAWLYPRLFWECGLIGQILYLEAEAAGLRGTGIGCFFDDAVHQILGLGARTYQDLYHFTVGGPIDDPRLSTLPAYPQ